MSKLYRAMFATIILLCSTMVVATGEGQSPSRPAAQAAPTFTRDVAPIRDEMQYTGFIYSVAPAAPTTTPRP
jgi:hypothetical protein